MNRESWISDKGRVGNDIITPFKKLLRGKLLDWQKEFCSGVDKIHWMIEQVIFHFKNWQIMSICHRRLFTTFRRNHISGYRVSKGHRNPKAPMVP